MDAGDSLKMRFLPEKETINTANIKLFCRSILLKSVLAILFASKKNFLQFKSEHRLIKVFVTTDRAQYTIM